MIISVKVPADVFLQAANVLKTNEYYVLHVAREEILSEDIRDIQRSGMGAMVPYPIIMVINSENESEWFLSQCESVQGNVMIFSWDMLLIGITEVTNQATLDLLNMTPYRHDNVWWDIVEERAREAFRTHSTDAGIHFDYRRHNIDDIDSLVDVGRVWYNDPVYQSFLSSLHSHPLDSIGFVPSDYATRRNGAPIIKVEDEPRSEEPKDTKPQMSINDLLFGGD